MLALLPLALLLTCHPGCIVLVDGYKFCGIDADDARDVCWQPCSTDADCCSSSQSCHDVPISDACGASSHDLGGTSHNYCGTSWCHASYECGTPCPNGTDDECSDRPDERCYADTPCGGWDGGDGGDPRMPPPLPPPDPTSAFRYCGTTYADASANCWQPCPGGDDVECCFGSTCFDTAAPAPAATATTGGPTDACPPSADRYVGTDRYYCGASWCDAAYSCGARCPGGTDVECPAGERCYADVPCDGTNVPPDYYVGSTDDDTSTTTTTRFSMYCGTSPEDAAELCWQPCRDDGDCCADQTCHANVIACDSHDNIGSDHFFCGSDYCDASYECRAPCPSGYDAECPAGYRCFPNAPCNANVRSYSSDWTSSEGAEMLDYGLPTRAAMVFRQYKLETTADEATTTTKTTTNAATNNAGMIVGIIFDVVDARN
ncbi:hypothetical protein ACHAXA_007711 [Cyclostephanos tholiformis]|uniref:Uncharacterized protein n=1 Tax=Cyclostephanos tholiformis TaxID=382380 RepID=A0ABD3RYC1_9STRA